MSNASEPDGPAGNETEPESLVSNATEAESPAAEPTKRRLPPSRIALLVFVAVAAVVIVLELRARWSFSSTYNAVDAAIAAGNKDAEGLYRDDLDKIVRGSPARKTVQTDGDVKEELFTWRGVLQTYRMRLYYGRGGFVQGLQFE